MSIIEVGRSNPYFTRCPICGKPDWCASFDGEDGYTFIVCKRDIQKTNIQGIDGEFYMYIGDSKKENNSIFENAHQHVVRTGANNPHSYKKFKEQSARRLEREEEVKPLQNSKLDEIYRELLSMLILEDRHREYLKKEGWTDEMIQAYQIKSFPVNDYERRQNNIKTKNPKRSELGRRLYEKFGDLTGVPGAMIREYNGSRYWTFAGYDGIIFPVPDVNRKIYRLRIRLENPPAKGGKYRNLSSYKEKEVDGKLVNIYENGTRSGNAIGFYDRNCYVPNDYYCTYLTEGEKKSMVGNSKLAAPFISVPGVNSFGLLIERDKETGKRMIDDLKEKGTKVLIIAFDADKTTNAKVMQSEKDACNLLKNEGFILGIASWDIALGKGIDDLILNGYRPRYTLA